MHGRVSKSEDPEAAGHRARLRQRLLDAGPSGFHAMHEKMSLTRWGVEVRDPCSDRRLIDYCMSIPLEALTSSRSPFALYDAAFEDRVPEQVRKMRRRGDQSADWFELLTAEQIAGPRQSLLAEPARRRSA
jgi:asparagine synthase (glutamine-hydrolysing)